MADGMGSAWVPPRRPLRRPPLQAGRMLDIQASMDIFTKQLAMDRGGIWRPSEASCRHGYFLALDDLRQKVNLDPLSSHDGIEQP